MWKELAGNALKAQRKALRTTTLSLVLSFGIYPYAVLFLLYGRQSENDLLLRDTRMSGTLWLRYRDAGIDSFEKAEEIQALSVRGRQCSIPESGAKRIVTEDEISSEMAALGGFMHAPENYVTKTEEGWLVNAPLVILDDSSFLEYCGMIGAAPRLDGAVVRNQIDDVTDPDLETVTPMII